MLYHIFLKKKTYTAHKRIVLPTKTENNSNTTQACLENFKGKIMKLILQNACNKGLVIFDNFILDFIVINITHILIYEQLTGNSNNIGDT